ncbi:hypothetical protein [Microbacterium oleivorans]|uniref:hypothetical protein n=1 Tax=Microbacterium oleivorans TaxID=273677 RepID=UPI0020402E8C|nr:hypothetical protein [Microbacterium oleivorans]MCM3696921.1 hypothetical protein [Microbacterium oleivorans]
MTTRLVLPIGGVLLSVLFTWLAFVITDERGRTDPVGLLVPTGLLFISSVVILVAANTPAARRRWQQQELGDEGDDDQDEERRP